MPYDTVEFLPAKLHKTVPGCHKPTTDTSVAKGRPQNTVVIVVLGDEDHRAKLFVSLALAFKFWPWSTTLVSWQAIISNKSAGCS